jgi:superoxide dismutase, Fe-Mn family
MAFKLPDLPYAKDALEPHIDAKTMEIHHGKHHNAYVTNLNNAVEGTEFADMDIADLMANISKVPSDKATAVRNNGGGHYNHSMFWQIMGPNGGGEPTGEIAKAIADTFGSFDELKKQVNAAGAGRFGSGWAWLVSDGGTLKVESTPNQDNPLMEGRYPILGVDVWEHAYYLKYQNLRPDYLTAWWNTIDWNAVNERFAKSKSS